MHIHKNYSRSSPCDYFDTTSALAVGLMTEVHSLLTHSFQIANDDGFHFYGYPIGHCHTNGNIRVVMCLLYPPTCSIIEEHLDVTPSIDLDVQHVTNFMMMMEKSCPERLLRHRCCELPGDLPV